MSAQDAVVRFFHDVDRQDWPAIRAGLTDTVHTDYTSLFAGEPEDLAADDLVARWKGLLPGFDATQHLLGPLTPSAPTPGMAVDEAEALRLECNVRGYHRLTGDGGSADEWIVAGRYTINVHRRDGGWAVAGITLHTSYQSGDPGLADIAAQRAGTAG